jgi:hypothetical protein
MPTKDAFNPDDPLPLFLADEPKQQGNGEASDRATISSLIFKASILAAAATAVGIAILWVGSPVTLFADVTASVVDKSTLQPATDQSTPTIQSTADAQALPPTAKDAPSRDEIAAGFEPADQSQTEISGPAESLLKQFQAWATDKDAEAQVGPIQPVQDAPAQVVQDAPAPVVQDDSSKATKNALAQIAENAPAPVQPIQKHRHVRPVHNARARSIQNARTEMGPVQNPRKKVWREQNARVEVPPPQDARAQDQFMQNTEPPPFPQTFGWRN